MITFEVEENTPTVPVEHDPLLIAGLVESYHKKSPPSFQSYQEGVQAGIRYALLALNVKIDGINKREGGSSQ